MGSSSPPSEKKNKQTNKSDSATHLLLDQDKNINLISLSILITCFLDNVWIKYGEKSHVSHFWELKGQRKGIWRRMFLLPLRNKKEI